MARLIQTPYYLIDEAALLANMEKLARLRALSGAKSLLALKCFATWPVFDILRPYMDGTTSSSLYELRLGAQEFGKETHGYSVAWADHEIEEAKGYADKLIFNSRAQLERFWTPDLSCGLRVNPGFSTSDFDLADPARPYSRLGESSLEVLQSVQDRISGVMFHYNCENENFELFDQQLHRIEALYGAVLHQLEWVSLGGGIHFTGKDYPLERLAARLKAFAQTYGVQVYLEPGEAAITQTTSLEVSVLDVIQNDKEIAIVDASTEAHMLDLLIYSEHAQLPQTGAHRYQIAGKTCLAGDIFGEAAFETPLQVGTRLSIGDAGGYTMVKKNWFNGVRMPGIVLKQKDGQLRVLRTFGYEDFKAALGPAAGDDG